MSIPEPIGTFQILFVQMNKAGFVRYPLPKYSRSNMFSSNSNFVLFT